MTIHDRLRAIVPTLLENPSTYAQVGPHAHQAPQALVDAALSSLASHADRTVMSPAWDIPQLTQALVGWGLEDPDGYAAFLAPVCATADEQRLTTLAGLYRADWVIRLLSDDHEFVLETVEGQVRLNHQDAVQPWQRLTGATEVAQAIQRQRGLPPLAPTPLTPRPASRRRR